MNANMLSRLTVIPSPGISKKAPKNVNGSPAAVQTARRVESVKKRTRKMSPRPDSPFRTMRSRRTLEILGREVPGRNPDAVGNLHGRDDLSGPRSGFRQPATVLQQHAQEHRRLAVHRSFAIRRRETVGHRGDVRQTHDAAVRCRDDRNPPEVFRGRRGALGT